MRNQVIIFYPLLRNKEIMKPKIAIHIQRPKQSHQNMDFMPQSITTNYQLQDLKQTRLYPKSSNQSDIQYNEPIKTARIPQIPYSQQSTPCLKSYSAINLNQRDQLLHELKSLEQENYLKKQALQRAQKIIDSLQQQITALSKQLKKNEKSYLCTIQEYEKQIQNSHNIIKQLEQKSLNSTYAYQRPIRVTEVKLSPSNSPKKNKSTQNSDNYYLKQIERLMLKGQVCWMNYEIQGLKNIIKSQEKNIENLQDDRQQTQNVLNLQLFDNYKDQFNDNINYRQLNRQNSIGSLMNRCYQQIIRNWQHYSNSLRACLFQCLDYINNFTNNLNNESEGIGFILNGSTNQSCFLQSTLLQIITKDICKIIQNFNKKILRENREIKSMMSQLINEIKLNRIN